MKITSSMLESLISKKYNVSNLAINNRPKVSFSGLDETTKALLGLPQETSTEIAKLKQALSILSSDVGYGTGSFYDPNGKTISDHWLAVIWSIASLHWSCGKDLAKNWSQLSNRYTDEGFEKAWNSYNPLHPNGISIKSLYKRANELSINPNTAPTQLGLSLTNSRFTLLDINDLAALPPTEHLIKGILPSRGLSAIYGPSGSGKTFLALDLIMAIACQTDWFGHKVKNVPVTYIGLEGKGGINNRIQAWRTKNPTLNPSNFKVILDNFDLMKELDVMVLAQTMINRKMNQGLIVIDTLNQASPGADENSSTDMGIIIKHLKLLQEMTRGLVLIVHHTGKNTAQGLRGHSSLKAALDANIEVTGGDKKSWTLEKSKDGRDGINFGFSLKQIELGKDSDNSPITSCVVERDNNVMFTKPDPKGSSQKAALKAIKQILKLKLKISVDEAIELIKPSLATVKANQRSNRAKTIVQGLIDSGYLQCATENDEDLLWLHK